MMKTSRRDFVCKSALAAAGIAFSSKLRASGDRAVELNLFNLQANNESPRVCVFSKHFPGTGYDELSAVIAKIGFDGIDLTVREEGHVQPENAARDLPLAVAAAERLGLKIFMITTSIVDTDDRFTEPILKTAASLGIKHYRMGPRYYDEKKSISANMAAFKTQLKKLDSLNRKYRIHGECQNHSGDGFGAPVWDLWEVLKDINSPWTGIQYDIFHATVEGTYSWPLGFNLVKPYIGSLDIKDFMWKKAGDKWELQSVALGDGMVDYKKFLALLKENKIQGPFSLHYEYLTEKDELPARSAKMEQDLKTFRKWLKDAGF